MSAGVNLQNEAVKIILNRRKIETFCILIVFAIVLLMSFVAILAIADNIFRWDILSDHAEKIVYLFLSAMGIIIGACFLLFLMVNISIISLSFEKIADRMEIKTKEDNEQR